jgi:hypothetical protein
LNAEQEIALIATMLAAFAEGGEGPEESRPDPTAFQEIAQLSGSSDELARLIADALSV